MKKQRAQTLKDLNFIEIQKRIKGRDRFLNLSDADFDLIQKMCIQDAEFLKRHNLMDYSLLIKSENINPSKNYVDQQNKRNIFFSTDRKEMYHIGTIDFLQHFDYFKKFEHTVKTWHFNPEKAKTISCQPPDLYADRFLHFIATNVIECQLKKHAAKLMKDNFRKALAG